MTSDAIERDLKQVREIRKERARRGCRLGAELLPSDEPPPIPPPGVPSHAGRGVRQCLWASHDPRNVCWNAEEEYGDRNMRSLPAWTEGMACGRL